MLRGVSRKFWKTSRRTDVIFKPCCQILSFSLPVSTESRHWSFVDPLITKFNTLCQFFPVAVQSEGSSLIAARFRDKWTIFSPCSVSSSISPQVYSCATSGSVILGCTGKPVYFASWTFIPREKGFLCNFNTKARKSTSSDIVFVWSPSLNVSNRGKERGTWTICAIGSQETAAEQTQERTEYVRGGCFRMHRAKNL